MVQPVELLLQPGAKPLRSRPQRSASHLPQEQSSQPCSAQVPQDRATCFRSASRARKAHTLSLLAEIPVAIAKSFNVELIVPSTDLAGTDLAPISDLPKWFSTVTIRWGLSFANRRA